MELIRITHENIESEHICCAIANNKDCQVVSKKAWLKESGHTSMSKGFTVYYTSQCPFTAKYVPLLEDVAKKKGVDFQAVHIVTKEQAQNALVPFTTFNLFYNGEFVTHEILSEKKFEKIIMERCM